MNKHHPIAARISRIMRPRSLRYQLLSRSLYILLGLFALVGILQYLFLSRFLYQNTVTNVLNEIRSLPPQVWTNDGNSPDARNRGPNGRETPFDLYRNLSTPITSFIVVNSDNTTRTIPGFLNHGPITKLSSATYQAVMKTGQSRWQLVTDPRGDREMLVLVPMNSFDGTTCVVQVSTPVRQLQAVLTNQVVIYIVLSLLAFAVGILIFIPSLRKTLRPLASMVKSVSRVNAGNLEERFTPNHPQAEIELLSHSFNDMLERLHNSFEKEREAKEKMRQFIADASHELRTPLTSIHGFLEILLRGAAHNPEQLKKSLTSMYVESERMNKLVQDLILLARLDREPQFDIQQQRIDLLIQDMEPQLQFIAGERHVSFQVGTEVTARFDLDRMKQVLLNLFNNAVQHTHPTDGRIDVTLTTSEEGAKLTVRDNGYGIPAEHVPHLFERFYRVDSSRARKNGGVGLGLSITKSIVEHHNGRIACESTVGKGTLFTVWLPN